MEQLWKIPTRENLNTGRNTCPSATTYTINSKMDWAGSEPGTQQQRVSEQPRAMIQPQCNSQATSPRLVHLKTVQIVA